MKGSLYGKTAHRLNLLEVGVVLIVLLVKLLQPSRSRAGEWRTRGGTAASATSVIERWGGVAGEHQGTTKGTFDDVQLSVLWFETVNIVRIKNWQKTEMTSFYGRRSRPAEGAICAFTEDILDLAHQKSFISDPLISLAERQPYVWYCLTLNMKWQEKVCNIHIHLSDLVISCICIDQMTKWVIVVSTTTGLIRSCAQLMLNKHHLQAFCILPLV